MSKDFQGSPTKSKISRDLPPQSFRISKDFNGSFWISKDFQWASRIFNDLQVFLRIFKDLLGFSRISEDFPGSLRISKVIWGSLKIFIDLQAFPKLPLHLFNEILFHHRIHNCYYTIQHACLLFGLASSFLTSSDIREKKSGCCEWNCIVQIKSSWKRRREYYVL